MIKKNQILYNYNCIIFSRWNLFKYFSWDVYIKPYKKGKKWNYHLNLTGRENETFGW